MDPELLCRYYGFDHLDDLDLLELTPSLPRPRPRPAIPACSLRTRPPAPVGNVHPFGRTLGHAVGNRYLAARP